MKQPCLGIVLILAAGGALPAAGQDKAQAILAQGAAEAQAGWQQGLSAPPVADTLEAGIDCAVHWEACAAAILDGRLVDRVMAALPPELQAQPSGERQRRWSDKIMARQDAEGGDLRPMLEAHARLKAPADALFAEAFTGEPGKFEQFVAKLAACRNP